MNLTYFFSIKSKRIFNDIGLAPQNAGKISNFAGDYQMHFQEKL